MRIEIDEAGKPHLEDASRKAMDYLNRAFADMMPRSAGYHYYTRDGSKDRYFYTTEKVNHKGSPRYVAGIYRYLSSKKQLKLVKSSGWAKKYRAKEVAQKYRDIEAKRVELGLQRK